MAKNKQKFIPTVSVIVTMYNAAQYVQECLQSLLDQTLENVEVIVIDDCSTDNSVAIVKNFLPKFEGRLNLMRMWKNSGYPGPPRNTALSSAKGEYIYFLDSDDFIDKTALEDLYKVAKEFDADVVHVEKYFSLIEENGEYKNQIGSFQEGGFVDKPTLETENLGQRVPNFIQKKYLWWGCNKLLRRKMIVDNKIKFPQMDIYEDFVFAYMCLISAKNYVRVPFISYHYRFREDSMSHKVIYVVNKVGNMVKAVSTLDDFMVRRKFFVDNPKFRYSMADFFAQWILDETAKHNFYSGGPSLGDVFAIYYNEVFSKKPSDNAALTTWLFLAINIYKLQTKNLENQIAELKDQLAKFQTKEENVN